LVSGEAEEAAEAAAGALEEAGDGAGSVDAGPSALLKIVFVPTAGCSRPTGADFPVFKLCARDAARL